jgi:aryl-alcohol dehydrogenase-like predicted oxidoreductase
MKYNGSPIALGTWPMSGDGRYGKIDDAGATEAIHVALDRGITTFDTAPGYGGGHAEELLGAALRGRRQQAIIATKFGVVSGPPGQPGRDSSRAHILDQIEQSLRRLQTDYVDIYMVHWPDPKTPLEETLRALDDLVRAGKARLIGVSNFDLELIVQCGKVRPIDVVQVGYNLFDRRMERSVFPYCVEHGIGVMAYGPLAHGLLTGAFAEDFTFEPRDWRSRGVVNGQPILSEGHFQQNIRVVNRLRDEVAAPKGLTVAQLALAWVMRQGAVTTAIVGARSSAEINEDLAATRTTLSDADLADIDGIMSGSTGRVDVFLPFRWAMERWN